MRRASAEKRRAAVKRLSQVREDEVLTAAHGRTVVTALDVSEAEDGRWVAPPKTPSRPYGPATS
jgi:putative transposase